MEGTKDNMRRVPLSRYLSQFGFDVKEEEPKRAEITDAELERLIQAGHVRGE